jgi:transposase-like protein
VKCRCGHSSVQTTTIYGAGPKTLQRYRCMLCGYEWGDELTSPLTATEVAMRYAEAIRPIEIHQDLRIIKAHLSEIDRLLSKYLPLETGRKEGE